MFGGGDVKRRIHRRSSELDVAAVLNGERLQRNDRQRVFHFTVGKRVAARESQVVGHVIDHAQRAASHQVDVVALVAVQIGHHVGTLRHIDGHIHREAHELGTFHDGLRGVGEVGEAHEAFKLVVGCQRRVAQDVGEVGGAQHIELSTHHQIGEQAVDISVEIHVGLAIGFRPRILLGVDEQEVLCPHLQIKTHARGVGEVELAVGSQRTAIVGIHVEVLEEQSAALDGHGVVVKAQAHTVGLAHHIGGVEVDFAIDDRSRQRSLHRHASFAVALEADDLIRDETVDERERHAGEVERRIEISLIVALVAIGAADGSYLLSFE